MNAKRTQNADTKTMGDKTQRSVLDRDELAQGQSDNGSGTGNSGTENLLVDTGESETTTSKTRRTKKKKRMTALQRLRAKSPFKTTAERKGRGRKGSATSFNKAPINRKLNQEQADCRSIEFQLQRTFGI